MVMNQRQINGLLYRLDLGHKGMGEETSLWGEAAATIRELNGAAEVWPTPGRPETFSERYHMFHRIHRKMMDKEPLTQDEAILVWRAMEQLTGAVPEGSIISSLTDELSHELRTGQRCGVCGRHNSEDYNCAIEC